MLKSGFLKKNYGITIPNDKAVVHATFGEKVADNAQTFDKLARRKVYQKVILHFDDGKTEPMEVTLN